MLVLARYPGEKIRIGLNITIELLEINSRRAKLGIIAPHDVRVMRDENCHTVDDLRVIEEADL